MDKLSGLMFITNIWVVENEGWGVNSADQTVQTKPCKDDKNSGKWVIDWTGGCKGSWMWVGKGSIKTAI